MPPMGPGGGPGAGAESPSTSMAPSLNRSAAISGGEPVSVMIEPEADQPDDVVNDTLGMSTPSTAIGTVPTSCTCACGVLLSIVVCVRSLYWPGGTFRIVKLPS